MILLCSGRVAGLKAATYQVEKRKVSIPSSSCFELFWILEIEVLWVPKGSKIVLSVEDFEKLWGLVDLDSFDIYKI